MNVNGGKFIPIKDFRLILKNKPSYLFAHLKSERLDFETEIFCWEEVIRFCHRNRARRVLILKEFNDPIHISFAHGLVKEICKFNICSSRTAFVDPVIDHYETNKFGQLAANNRGIFIKAFVNIAEAQRWLLSEEDLF